MAASYDARSLEARWSRLWERDGCYRAPELPDGPKFFNYDSGPFPNGPLHMGHVRTYLLGDITARYQRALGREVLYCTEWDAFGLPNELEALRASVSPAEHTQRWIDTMERQLRTLGISYDWSRIRSTNDPDYYRWTQWLFLRFREWGLISRREAELPYCSRCETTLAGMQVVGQRCWRCASEVETRRLNQWFVTLSGHNGPLLEGLDRLDGWSPQVRNLVRGLVHGRGERLGDDWVISRQRSWGTPIPMVCCDVCDFVPVPIEQLPVRLPDDLDWELGSKALASNREFVEVECPVCGERAERETDTLDCFFDDIWCQVSPLVDLESEPGFRTARVDAWLPVDRFHSGFDTVSYLHLHRFFGAVFHEHGELATAEPIRTHLGHEMVLAQGHKMSKHLGNAVSPTKLMRKHGADALRLAMLWAATPGTAINWAPERIDRAVSLLEEVHRFFASPALSRLAETPPRSSRTALRSKALVALSRRAETSVRRIGRFIDEYRPNAAIDEWARLFGRTRAYTKPRIENSRLSEVDAAGLRKVVNAELITLSLFAPHLAEELWQKTGHRTYVVQEGWPLLKPHE